MNDYADFDAYLDALSTSKRTGTCVFCAQPFSDTNVFTAAGWRETGISGSCEVCFDTITKEPEEPE